MLYISCVQLQLQQQMQRHADAMEQARLQSEGTIENLRKKLNTLQDVSVPNVYCVCGGGGGYCRKFNYISDKLQPLFFVNI